MLEQPTLYFTSTFSRSSNTLRAILLQLLLIKYGLVYTSSSVDNLRSTLIINQLLLTQMSSSYFLQISYPAYNNRKDENEDLLISIIQPYLSNIPQIHMEQGYKSRELDVAANQIQQTNNYYYFKYSQQYNLHIFINPSIADLPSSFLQVGYNNYERSMFYVILETNQDNLNDDDTIVNLNSMQNVHLLMRVNAGIILQVLLRQNQDHEPNSSSLLYVGCPYCPNFFQKLEFRTNLRTWLTTDWAYTGKFNHGYIAVLDPYQISPQDPQWPTAANHGYVFELCAKVPMRVFWTDRKGWDADKDVRICHYKSILTIYIMEHLNATGVYRHPAASDLESYPTHLYTDIEMSQAYDMKKESSSGINNNHNSTHLFSYVLTSYIIYCESQLRLSQNTSPALFWFSPFDLKTWLGIIVFGAMSLPFLSSSTQQMVDKFYNWLAIIFKQELTGNGSTLSKMGLLLIFCMMIITSLYESVITSVMTIPPEPIILSNMQEFFGSGYKLYEYQNGITYVVSSVDYYTKTSTFKDFDSKRWHGIDYSEETSVKFANMVAVNEHRYGIKVTEGGLLQTMVGLKALSPNIYCHQIPSPYSTTGYGYIIEGFQFRIVESFIHSMVEFGFWGIWMKNFEWYENLKMTKNDLNTKNNASSISLENNSSIDMLAQIGNLFIACGILLGVAIVQLLFEIIWSRRILWLSFISNCNLI